MMGRTTGLRHTVMKDDFYGTRLKQLRSGTEGEAAAGGICVRRVYYLFPLNPFYFLTVPGGNEEPKEAGEKE